MKGVIHTDNPNSMENIRYVFGGAERQEEYVQAKLTSEVHILGSIHCVCAMFDVFSHLVNGLVLGNAMTVRDCTIKSVTKRLPSCTLEQELQSLLDSQWFKYVEGFLNTAKHRGLVQHVFQVSLVHAQAGIRLSGFEYEGTTFRAYSVEELLVGVLEVKNRVVHCGRIINEHVIEGKI